MGLEKDSQSERTGDPNTLNVGLLRREQQRANDFPAVFSSDFEQDFFSSIKFSIHILNRLFSVWTLRGCRWLALYTLTDLADRFSVPGGQQGTSPLMSWPRMGGHVQGSTFP